MSEVLDMLNKAVDKLNKQPKRLVKILVNEEWCRNNVEQVDFNPVKEGSLKNGYIGEINSVKIEFRDNIKTFELVYDRE